MRPVSVSRARPYRWKCRVGVLPTTWMQLPEWRFYRSLASDLAPDNGTAQIALRGNDPVSAGYVDRAVRFWKTSGALAHAREQRAGDIAFEVGQLQDGMVCHN